MKRAFAIVIALALSCAAPGAESLPLQNLQIDRAALAEAVPLVMDALQIGQNAMRREALHKSRLALKGIAEEPPSKAAVRYTIDLGGLGDFLFDDWGELYIDRRFVTDDELERIKRIEAFARKNVIEPFLASQGAKGKAKPEKRKPRSCAGGAGLPVFRGFEDERYQMHDDLIARMVREFNASKAAWCGGNPDQAAKIADLTAALVKAHMIEEAGGNGPRSKAAWLVDPLQVNVPGDWGREKELVGLVKPSKRNEGNVTNNVMAAIKYLSRKGFGASARPAAERPKGFFDGWRRALQRYNGRRDRTDTDRWYSDEYADKILKRASAPDVFVPIEIKLKK